jgi:protease-4
MVQKRTMRQRLFRVFTVVGAIVTGIVLLSMMVSIARCAFEEGVPDTTILEVNLEQPLVEGSASDPVAKLMGQGGMSLRDLVEAIERAGSDDRVVGLVAYVGGGGLGMATIEEVRDAVIQFRDRGKFAVVFSETFGEGAAGNGGYYLATAFDEIWLQPSGDVGLTGLMAESPFIKGTLELLGVTFRGDHRKEYKNALNLFTERYFTSAHREATKAIMNDAFGQIVGAIAGRRGLSEDGVRKLADRGPYVAQEALEAGLVDKLGYRDEALEAIKARAGEDSQLLFASHYLERAGRPHENGEKIALIYGVGPVMRGPSGIDPLFGGPSMGSDTVAGAIRAAVADDDVKAIVFRVDSPGGSYVASDTIWRETMRAKDAGKPVVVSMGNVAGSGGYFVAMGAAKIVAHPSTITGSIGVLTGKPLTRELWSRFGITWDEVHTSRNATTWSSLHDYTMEGWGRLQVSLDRIYEDFTGKVATGRGLSIERVQEIAKGRIWSGVRAKEIGLVDELGGYATALRLAREEAGLDADAEIELRVFPPERSMLAALLADEPESSEAAGSASVEVDALGRLRPVVEQLRLLGLASGAHGVLSMPPVQIGP